MKEQKQNGIGHVKEQKQNWIGHKKRRKKQNWGGGIFEGASGKRRRKWFCSRGEEKGRQEESPAAGIAFNLEVTLITASGCVSMDCWWLMLMIELWVITVYRTLCYTSVPHIYRTFVKRWILKFIFKLRLRMLTWSWWTALDWSFFSLMEGLVLDSILSLVSLLLNLWFLM